MTHETASPVAGQASESESRLKVMIQPMTVGAAIDEGKSTLFAGSTGNVASGGQGGTKFICYSGKSVGSMPVPNVTGASTAEVAANAVTFGNGIVYVAQGSAGFYMYAVDSGVLNLLGCDGYGFNYVA